MMLLSCTLKSYAVRILVIVQAIKSRRVRLAGRVALTGERRGVYRVLVGKPGGKRPLGIPRHSRIILRWIFRKWDMGCGLD